MKPRVLFYLAILFAAAIGCAGLLILAIASPLTSSAAPPPSVPSSPHLPLADNPDPPSTPVKLIFIHHSCGGNWLADPNTNDGNDNPGGALGRALMNNNYFVSATNYGWSVGEDVIGDRTDIINWPEWFTDTIMSALYVETGQYFQEYGTWPRMADPGGENQIIMFKSCYPNSDLYGQPTDEPDPGETPTSDMTVRNAKAVYNHILTYFAAHQDKLFIVITAPPMAEGGYGSGDQTPAERAANARAFNNWLVNNWLAAYPHQNVAVFDYYNVLTSNGGDIDTNDYNMRPNGNHHYWDGAQITHTQTVNNNFAAYPVDDGHPSTAGHQKATAEFVPLLNVYYNRWKDSAPPQQPALNITQPAAGASWPVSSTRQIQWTTGGSVTQVNLFYSADHFVTSQTITLSLPNTGSYAWITPPTPTTSARVRVESTISPTTVYDVSDTFTLYQPGVMDKFVYLPLALRNYSPAPPACAVPLTGVAISGPTGGYTDTLYTFTANPTPANATTPIAYTWSPAPESGQGAASAAYRWNTAGSKSIQVTAGNCDGAHTANDSHAITIQAQPGGDLVQPGDLVYLGAFRLPGDDTPPQTFAYGGNAMTFNPDGHITNTDAYSGSLFITGHDRTDDYADGSQVAEITIPAPVNSRNVGELPYADLLQGFHDVAAGHFQELSTIPKIGIQYLNHPDTGPKIHLTWGRHLQQLEDYLPSQAWFDPDLANPDLQGEWFIGGQNPNSVNGYMFEVPAAWADTHAQSRYLATGRFSPGGLGGMGPALLAYRPWLTGGAAPISGTHLSETPLLLYESAMVTSTITHCMNNYQHADEWEGGAWITTPSGKSAVLFAGTKGTGIKYWYGYIHPTNPMSPCVDMDVIGDFWPCRLADGAECPATDVVHCCTEGEDCVSARGWWSTRSDAQFILYNPADLAQVAAGTLESWEPQPYAVIDVDEHLYFNPPEWDEFEVGWGDQRRNRISAAAYDRANGYLYVLEVHGDEAKPMVHVWQVQQ